MKPKVNSDEDSGSKVEMHKFHDVLEVSLYGSFMIPVITLCIVMFAESLRQAKILPAKSNLSPKRRSLNVNVLFIK